SMGSDHGIQVFAWLGNAAILLALVKLLEDRMNVDYDVSTVGVQTIILVEDSVRYYSAFLPLIYRALIEQTLEIIEEGLNDHQRTMRMRGRPKILLAHSYEDALSLYDTYKKNVLGIISDIAFYREGQLDPTAGLALIDYLRETDPDLPVLLQSSEPDAVHEAMDRNAAFAQKQSKTLLYELRDFISLNLGFGDFIFRLPGTFEQVAEATDLAEMQQKLATIPDASLEYHATNHHISRWLKARALFSLAEVFMGKRFNDFENINALRQYLINTIKSYRIHAARGTIATFHRRWLDQAVFQRIGSGSLGGKARGIAFINSFLKRRQIMFHYDDVVVQIPKTVVLTTEVFERFMEQNQLYDMALSDDVTDGQILRRFLSAELPEDVVSDLVVLIKAIRQPLAVRSSSLLEDSHYQPFAGVYGTYFIPNNHPSKSVRLRELLDAIRGVYASTFYEESKRYVLATHNVIDQEKMAVIVQEVAGTAYNGAYYPQISGVARSVNYYPIGRERPEQGVANLAVGLGKTVVDGGVSLRFSPAHPKKVLQLYDVDSALKSTQRRFYALDLKYDSFEATPDQSANLLELDVEVAGKERANRAVFSTFDRQNHRLRDDARAQGRRVVTFSPILKHKLLPLPKLISLLLDVGSDEMNVEVEIEFAVDLDVPDGGPAIFHFLQIRPIVEDLEVDSVGIGEVDPKTAVVTANTALGNGIHKGLCDVVYVKPDSFDRAATPRIAALVASINAKLTNEGRRYILIGPGRWGSSDPWLGIPVKWANINNAAVIVEASLGDFRVEASQGSHFFQNITSFQVAYLTVEPSVGDGTYDVEFLDQQPALYEDEFLRHVRFDCPSLVKVDCQHSEALGAVIFKPEYVPAVELFAK
ncbi:MAG: phosphoenolpyruvate synthase, partial [Proteobacteria bacterium]|nr:phosphoenolpyruvate synthase [Pseudomonadota bacterium]